MGNNLNLCLPRNKIYLPGDVHAEILCRLPVNSLLRFRTVCKSWKRLIDSPVFVQKHLLVQITKSQSPGLSFSRCNRQEEFQDNDLGQWRNQFFYIRGEFFPPPLFYSICQPCRIFGSSNGLICVETSHPVKPFLLFNPSTREFSFLPSKTSGELVDSFGNYDGEKKNVYHGFCFLPKIQEYRVFSFFMIRNNLDRCKTKIVMRILRLGKNPSWREIEEVLPGLFRNVSHQISGTSLFWLGFDAHEKSNGLIICFDLIEERFSSIPLPPSVVSVKLGKKLSSLHDSIVMFVSPVQTWSSNSFDIWILNDIDGMDKTWTKQRKVGPLASGVIMRPLNIILDGKILIKGGDANSGIQDYLFYYDLKTEQIESCSSIKYVASYVKSLVSVSNLVPCIDKIV